ncbi:oxidoreductase [Aliidongia dinghuensis]|uniref:Oxidoreductase n=1 Tax=Aliidongia dinghuensis TaxID=1867774 RepID=A0A8J3E3K4_9PROT|nr:molybdopterin oxidoreductase family protein [Aliidongia dinghuensis]GGF19403.1 oxidoreductase [Aliidongia dinghuensis]
MATHYRACNLCEAICGLTIEVEDDEVEGGRVVSIKGDADDPFSRGHICPKAVALKDIQDDPDRLRAPVRRDGNGWREIGWDEAFAFAAEGIAAVVRAHGADAVATYQGNPTVHNWGLMTHAAAYLGLIKTKNRYSATSVDQLPFQLAAYWMYGHQLLLPIPDIDRTDYFLMLGANPLVSNGSLMTVPDVAKRLKALKARGGQLIVVDPRRTETAEVASAHHFIRPGTDAAFLLALLSTLWTEGLARPGRLADHLDGFEAAMARIAPFTAERAAPVTGIPADEIRRIARDFAAASRAVCYGRMGVSTQAHGTLCHWLIQLLNIATGNLDRVGGALVTKPAFDIVGAPGSRPGSYGRWASRVGGRAEVLGELPVAALAEEMLTPGPGQVRALITIAGNPVLSTPNGRQLERGLAGLDFMVSLDPYLNETTRHASVILPPTTALEHDHYDMTFNLFAVRNVARWNPPVLPKPAGALDDWQILEGLGTALATALGLEPRRTPAPAQMLDVALRAGPYGLTLAELEAAPHGLDLGPLEPSFPDRLATADKRIQCAPPPVLAALDRLDETLFGGPAPDLVLIGRRHIRSNNSWMHNFERLVKGKPRCQLLMHPDDLGRYGFADGQRVRVTSRVGSLDVEVAGTTELMPGVVSLPHGWGHGRDGVALGVARAHAGVSINDLTDDAFVDPVSGNAALNGLPVWVAAISG